MGNISIKKGNGLDKRVYFKTYNPQKVRKNLVTQGKRFKATNGDWLL